MKKTSIIIILLVSLQACALHPPRFDDCCYQINRKDTKFETAEQVSGAFLTVGGFVSFISAFVVRAFIPSEDLKTDNQILGVSLTAAFMGTFLIWDGEGAFQEIGKCHKKPACAQTPGGFSNWDDLLQSRLNK